MLEILRMPREQRLRELAKEYSELDQTALTTCIHLLKAAHDIEEALVRHYASYGISQGRFYVLMFLHGAKDGSFTSTELANLSCVKAATITGLVDGLVASGWVERAPDLNDRRIWRVKITAKGRKFLKQMLPDHFKRMSLLMKALSTKQRSQLNKSLKTITDGIGALRDHSTD